jgi:mannose-1-phosphate guanylyltransferase
MLVQPCNRDTGPGMLFALNELAKRDAGAMLAVFPSDHYVGNRVSSCRRVPSPPARTRAHRALRLCGISMFA